MGRRPAGVVMVLGLVLGVTVGVPPVSAADAVGENTIALCTNGIDDDGDTYVDAIDPECYALGPAAAPRMECTATAYLVQTGTSLWTKIDLITGESVTVDDDHPTGLNGIGFNQTDGRIWGYNVTTNDGSLSMTVESPTGTFTTVTTPPIPGLPIAPWNIGDVDENGVLHLANSSLRTVRYVDVNPASPTYLTFLGATTYSDPMEGADFAKNPVDGNYYTIDGATGNLIRLNPVTENWSDLGPSGVTDTGAYGAVYFDAEGFFYASSNVTGNIYRLDLSSDPGSNYDESQTILFSEGPFSTGNDGAFCAGAVVGIDLGDAPDSYGTTLAEDGPRHGFVNLDEVSGTSDLMLGATVDREADGQPSVGAVDDTGEDGADFTAGIVVGSAIEYAVVVTNQLSSSVSLCGWIDFDQDGTFGDGSGEESCVTVPVSGGASADCVEQGTSGVFDCVVPWTPPAGTTYLESYARLRVGSRLDQVGSPLGAATDGEVEDYAIALTTLPVTVASFASTSSGGGVDVVWWSGTETANAGYIVYGDDGAGNVVALSELVPGAGDSLNPLEYSVSVAAGYETLWLADVDVRGVETLNGPYRVGELVGTVPVIEELDWVAPQAEVDTVVEADDAERGGDQSAVIEAAAEDDAVVSVSTSSARDGRTTAAVEAGVGAVEAVEDVSVAMRVETSGLYRVTFDDLLAAGIDWTGVASASLAVVDAAGVPVQVHVGGGRKVGAGSFIEFWGEGVDTLYTGVNVYRLVIDQSLRVKMAADRSVQPSWGVDADQSFVHTEVFREQLEYSMVAPGGDPWYWARVLAFGSPSSFDAVIELTDVVAGEATVSVRVWGGIDAAGDADHHVTVAVNGVPAGDVVFDGISETVVSATVADGVLVDGANTVSVTVVGDGPTAFDWINLDEITVAYPRSITAVDGTAVFTSTSERVEVDGLDSPVARVLRFDGDLVTRIVKRGYVREADGSFTVSFAGTGSDASYAFVERSQMLTPDVSAARVPVGLLDGSADLLIISHSVFSGELDALVAAREAQGLAVKVVEVEDLYAAYTGEVFDPAAISAYIADAATVFGDPAVLLVGADSYDYRDYSGVGSIAYIPTLYGDVGIGDTVWSPLDPMFVDVDGDQVPDLDLGRFPVRDLDELNSTITKTLNYTPGTSAVFAAGAGYGQAADTLAAALPAGSVVTTAYLDDLAIGDARDVLLDEINSGTDLAVYFGHSSTGQWSSEALLTTADVGGFTNTADPATVIQFGCWNTYFSDPTQPSLGTALLTSPGGASTVLGATTLTSATHDAQFGPVLIGSMNTATTVGGALTAAKHDLDTQVSAPDIALGWTLLGDPTTPTGS